MVPERAQHLGSLHGATVSAPFNFLLWKRMHLVSLAHHPGPPEKDSVFLGKDPGRKCPAISLWQVKGRVRHDTQRHQMDKYSPRWLNFVQKQRFYLRVRYHSSCSKALAFESKRPEFGSTLCHLLAGWPWVSYFASLSLCPFSQGGSRIILWSAVPATRWELSKLVAVNNFHDSSLPHFTCPVDPDRSARTPPLQTSPISVIPIQGFMDSQSCWGIFLRGRSLPGWAEDYKVWLRVSRSNLVLPMKIKDGSTLRCQVNTVW